MFASGIPTAEKPTAKKYFLMSHGPDADRDETGDKWAEYKVSQVPSCLRALLTCHRSFP